MEYAAFQMLIFFLLATIDIGNAVFNRYYEVKDQVSTFSFRIDIEFCLISLVIKTLVCHTGSAGSNLNLKIYPHEFET